MFLTKADAPAHMQLRPIFSLYLRRFLFNLKGPTHFLNLGPLLSLERMKVDT